MMAKSKWMLKAQSTTGNRLSVEDPADYNKMVPLFSLERIQKGEYCLSRLEKDDKAAFVDSIFKRKDVTWNQIQQMDRHGLGCEKIAVSSIKTKIPIFITEDQSNLIAFRFNGLKAMVGYRSKNVFYILWFDHDFTVYKH